MTEIEEYAVGLVGTGALSYAEDDIDEEGEFENEDNWRAARSLGLEMAVVIRRNPEAFLRWYLNEASL